MRPRLCKNKKGVLICARKFDLSKCVGTLYGVIEAKRHEPCRVFTFLHSLGQKPTLHLRKIMTAYSLLANFPVIGHVSAN
jgi:hypothetical protein